MIRRIGYAGMFGLVCVLAILVLVSCGPRSAEALAEKMIEKAAALAGEEIDINLEDNEVLIKDDNGHTLTVGGSDLPETWPDSVPFDNRLKIGMVNSYQKDGKDNWNITSSYEGPATDIHDYYKDALTDWTISSDNLTEAAGGNMYTLGAANGSFEMRVIIAEQEDLVTTAILLNRL